MHVTYYLLPLLLQSADATLRTQAIGNSLSANSNNNLFIRQSCSTGKLCGDGCIRFSDSCCGSDGTSCPAGYYCDGTGAEAGCCETGEICSGLGLTCAGDTVRCGLECIIPGTPCESGAIVPSLTISLSSTARTTTAAAVPTTSAVAAPVAPTTTSTSEFEESTSSSSSSSSTRTSTTTRPSASVASGTGSSPSVTAVAGGGGASGAGRAFDMAWIGGGILGLMGYAAF